VYKSGLPRQPIVSIGYERLVIRVLKNKFESLLNTRSFSKYTLEVKSLNALDYSLITKELRTTAPT